MHLRLLDDGSSLRLVPQLLHRERGAQDVFSHRSPAVTIRCADPHRIVETEPGVPPAEEFADNGPVNPSLAEEQPEHAVAKEMLQGIEINLWKRNEPAGRRENAIGHQGMQVGMEFDQIAIGLDDYDDARDGPRVLTGSAEERLQGVGRALAQLSQEAAVFPEVDAQHFRNGKNVLTMGDRGQNLVGHPRPELEHALLVAGGAEVPPFARERQEILVPTRITPHPGEPLGEVAAREEFLHDAADDGAVEAVLFLVPGGIGCLEFAEVGLHALVEG